MHILHFYFVGQKCSKFISLPSDICYVCNHGGEALTRKGNTVCPAVKTIHQTPFCSRSEEDPSFLKLLIFNKKIDKFFEFRRSQSPFSPKFQLFTSFFKNYSSSSPICAKKPFFRLNNVRCFAPNTPTHFKVECPPG